MQPQFIFSDFVNDLAVDFTAYVPTAGAYDNTGKWIAGATTPVTMKGIVTANYGNDSANFAEDGMRIELGKRIITTKPLKIGTKIEYNGEMFIIDNDKDNSPYTGIYIYGAKGAGK